MVNFLFPGFNRRYVIIAMLAAVTVVLIGYGATEYRRSYTAQLAVGVRNRQERLRELAEMIYSVADAESAQRGFLLTLDPGFLTPFEEAKHRADITLNSLMTQYATHESDELQHLADAKKNIDNRFTEMQDAINKAKQATTNADALQAIRTDIDMHWMEGLRAIFEGMRARERDRVYADVDYWDAQVKKNRYMAGAVALVNILLLLAIGMLVIWEIERRNAAAMKLNSMVEERTAELTNLSKHMLSVREDEKLRLARELHDELGGLLVAIKIDLSQLAKKFDFTSDPDVVVRWKRIHNALSAGVELKRRVIEELRPTLLDNLGLVAAIRWQCEETCSQANLTLVADFPEEELKVDLNIAIAIFRVAQETLTNIVKHARATIVKVTLKGSNEELMLSIEDNGIGFDNTTRKISGSHGLLSMKYRMQAIGGTFQILPASPHGTKVIVWIGLDLANKLATLE